MWYTGYDGTRGGLKMLGYATSPDGIHWTPDANNPIYRGHWVEDMMVVKHGSTYYMFAEGLDDHAQLLSSSDKIHWSWLGFLDIRTTDGKPIPKGPYGTPTAWFENGRWYLFYERGDKAVWLAQSKDLNVFTNVQDTPVLTPGPSAYDGATSLSIRSSNTRTITTRATTARPAASGPCSGRAIWRLRPI